MKNGHRPDCSYVRESLTQQEEKTYLPRSLPIQSKHTQLPTQSNTNASTPNDNANIGGMNRVGLHMNNYVL